MSGSGLPRTSDAIVLLPGIMGSELVDRDGKVVWGMKLGLLIRQAVFHNALARLALPEDGEDDGIRASRPVQLPVKLPLLTSIEPYRNVEERLRGVALRREAVLTFAYDWRRSIEEAAAALAAAAERHLERWRRSWQNIPLEERRQLPEPQLTLVGHSMGGLVARWFTEVLGGRDLVRQIITLGTPFAGSLNAVRVLADGDYLPLALFASALRDTGRTFNGLYELVPLYQCVEENNHPNLRTITAADIVSVGAEEARAAAAIAIHERLTAAVQAAGAARCPIRALIGVQQPTFQTVQFHAGTATFAERLRGEDHRGDGTVYRYSAAPHGVEPLPLPQTHGALAKTEEAIAFIEHVLTDRDLGEVQAPPGFGIRLPDMVGPGQPFDVSVIDGESGGTCRVTNAETNEQVAVSLVTRRAQDAAATVSIPNPGLYRVTITSGGYSSVQELVLCLAG
jgi:pimeloyl-ACP methyl ester carboxylesterase